jgi:transcriptional regulator with XRE-family HTH domain
MFSKRLISENKKGYFANKLRKIRISRNILVSELAETINKSTLQINRYEGMIKGDVQEPPLSVLADICVALQVDANTLLGLKWVESKEPPNRNTIYNWEMKKDKIYWICPNCGGENITYGDFTKDRFDLENITFTCEYDNCGSYFDKLHKMEIKIKMSAIATLRSSGKKFQETFRVYSERTAEYDIQLALDDFNNSDLCSNKKYLVSIDKIIYDEKFFNNKNEV